MKWIDLTDQGIQLYLSKDDKSEKNYIVVSSLIDLNDEYLKKHAKRIPYQCGWLLPSNKDTVNYLMSKGGKSIDVDKKTIELPYDQLKKSIIDVPATYFDQGLLSQALSSDLSQNKTITPFVLSGLKFFVMSVSSDHATIYSLLTLPNKGADIAKVVVDEKGTLYKLGRKFEVNAQRSEQTLSLDEVKHQYNLFVESNASFGYASLGLLQDELIEGIWFEKNKIYYLGYECNGEKNKDGIIFCGTPDNCEFNHVDLPDDAIEVDRFPLDLSPADRLSL